MSEFTIDSCPEVRFRDMYCSPVAMLAITTQVDFDDYGKTEKLFAFALEHLECEVAGKWVPVKVPGRDVFMPIGIEKNYAALNDLVQWYVTNIIAPAFPASGV